MRQRIPISLATAGALALAGCAMDPGGAVTRQQVAEPAAGAGPVPVYQGIETQLLEGDLVRFRVRMTEVAGPEALAAYANCAAAQYALIRGYGFARHLRTHVALDGASVVGDAVYTISPALPRGTKTIDAEVTVSNCRELGIPTV